MATPVIDAYKEVLACLVSCATATETGDFLKLNPEVDMYKQSLKDLKETAGDRDQRMIHHLEKFGREFTMDLLDAFRYTGSRR
jgi:hypothetical protein